MAIKNYTGRNYKLKGNKIVESRVKLLQLLLALLRAAGGQPKTNTPVASLPELKHKGTSFQELDVSNVRLIIEELDEKVYELSTISEQIPQLETFKRTLDLTMPEHNAYLTKIVDVLIELHHKINKLISRRPEKLLKEIEAVEQECLIIETATSEFIQKLESQTVNLKCIYYDQRSNKSPDYFRKIQKNTVRLSEIILECLATEAETHDRILHIKSLIEIFWNLIAGMEEYEREWLLFKQKEDKTEDEEQIIEILEMCLNFVNDRIDKMNEEFDIERQQLIDGNNKNVQFMEEDLNKLIHENEEQKAIINELENENRQLRDRLKESDARLDEIRKRSGVDANDQTARIQALERKEKTLLDRIAFLEGENEKKKTVINDLTNDLKRAMKDADNSLLINQKNKELQTEVRNLKKDIDDLNRRIHALEAQLEEEKRRGEREAKRLREELEESERKVKKIEQSNFESTLLKKDEKIAELNGQIVDLNARLTQMLNDFKNMEFDLQRRQKIELDLEARIKQFELGGSAQYQELSRNFEANQRELNNALAEVNKLRNVIVPELEAEIRRREGVIAELQRTIKELEDALRVRDSKIAELEARLRNNDQNGNRVRELEQQIRNL